MEWEILTETLRMYALLCQEVEVILLQLLNSNIAGWNNIAVSIEDLGSN